MNGEGPEWRNMGFEVCRIVSCILTKRMELEIWQFCRARKYDWRFTHGRGRRRLLLSETDDERRVTHRNGPAVWSIISPYRHHRHHIDSVHNNCLYCPAEAASLSCMYVCISIPFVQRTMYSVHTRQSAVATSGAPARVRLLWFLPIGA